MPTHIYRFRGYCNPKMSAAKDALNRVLENSCRINVELKGDIIVATKKRPRGYCYDAIELLIKEGKPVDVKQITDNRKHRDAISKWLKCRGYRSNGKMLYERPSNNA